MKGARDIMVQSEIDLSGSPAALSGFGTNRAGLTAFGNYCEQYNIGFSNAVNAFSRSKPDLRIIWVDLFSRLNDVLANKAEYGFSGATIDALDDPALTNKTFTGPGADYVFWNRLHGTSKLHQLISTWNLAALTNAVLETLDETIVYGAPAIQMNHLQIGRNYTLQTSSDLNQWQDVRMFTAGAGTNQWANVLGGVASAFYRLKWEP
jgi:phospholipase/lecithinase/hemolysin